MQPTCQFCPNKSFRDRSGVYSRRNDRQLHRDRIFKFVARAAHDIPGKLLTFAGAFTWYPRCPAACFTRPYQEKSTRVLRFFCLDQELLLAKESEILIVKVYYADTDAGGVVYYANYLRWFEMDRSEFLEERDVSVAEYARQGYLFAVAHLEIDYLVSAVLGDKLEIRTEIERVRHVRFFVRQSVVRCSDGELLASARLSLACLTPEGKITAMPKSLAKTLKSAIPADGQH
jgi:acyl-CoA thioester hydrolase